MTPLNKRVRVDLTIWVGGKILIKGDYDATPELLEMAQDPECKVVHEINPAMVADHKELIPPDGKEGSDGDGADDDSDDEDSDDDSDDDEDDLLPRFISVEAFGEMKSTAQEEYLASIKDAPYGEEEEELIEAYDDELQNTLEEYLTVAKANPLKVIESILKEYEAQ